MQSLWRKFGSCSKYEAQSYHVTQQLYSKVIKTYVHKNLHTNVHGIIHDSRKVKQPKWKNKMLYSHTEDYYSAMKRNEVLIHTITQTNPKNIMLIF